MYLVPPFIALDPPYQPAVLNIEPEMNRLKINDLYFSFTESTDFLYSGTSDSATLAGSAYIICLPSAREGLALQCSEQTTGRYEFRVANSSSPWILVYIKKPDTVDTNVAIDLIVTDVADTV